MSAVAEQLPLRGDVWRRPLVALALLVAAIGLIYRDTLVGMVAIWMRSETFTHAFLVPPISAWLAWRKRDELAGLVPRPVPWLLLPLGAVAAFWLVSDLVAVNAATQFAFVAMLVLAVPTVLGWQVARTVLFPLGFLFFAVPVGEFLMPMLMEQTADFTIFALQFTGIPVYREGLRFVIPSGSWSVVEACSGVRYLIASLMVGTLFAYLNYATMWRRWVFVGVAIVVPIVANWLRAYMIVMIGHLSDNRLAVGVDHLIYGWVFFGVVILVMFMIGARWSEPERRTAPPAALLAGPGGQASRLGVVTVTALALGVLLLPAAVLQLLQHQAGGGTPVVTLPAALAGGWQREAQPPTWEPRFAAASATANATYAADGRRVGVFVAYYRAQNYERKLVSSQNVLVTSEDLHWNQLGRGTHVVDLAGGERVALRTADLLSTQTAVAAQGAAPRLTAWTVYWVDDTLTPSDVTAKLRGAFGRLAGRGDDAAAIVVSTIGPSREDNERLLHDFVTANLGALREQLRAARREP